MIEPKLEKDKDTYKFPDPIPPIEPERQKRAEEIFGMFQTVSAAPTAPPKNFLNQIQIYTNGATLRLYWWDNTNNLWHYVTATA